MTGPEYRDQQPAGYYYQPPPPHPQYATFRHARPIYKRRWTWVAALVAVAALLLAVGVVAKVSKPSQTPLQTKSYQLGYNEIGPQSAVTGAEAGLTPNVACENGMTFWAMGRTGAVNPDEARSGLNLAYDHDSVLKGCLDYLHGRGYTDHPFQNTIGPDGKLH